MDYKNEKLNIEIINNIFEIEEGSEQIGLYFEQDLAYTISANSKVEASITGFGVEIEAYDDSRVSVHGNHLAVSHDRSHIRAYGNSEIEAYNKSVVDASEKAVITAYDNCSITADDKVEVEAHNNSFIRAYQDSTVAVLGNSSVVAFNKAKIEAWGNSKVISYQNSKIEAWKDSKITAYDNSEVVARDNSLIRAYGASKVRACANSKIMAYDFSTIYVDSVYTEIKTHNHYGAIIGQVFKAKRTMRVYKKLADDLIATLELSKGQEFQSEDHHKCRTYRALVVAIESKDKSKSYKRGVSQYKSNFVYEVGKEVIADKYYSGISECSHGIHFFLNRKSAEEY